ncbi:MAG: sec-independent protein translocase protein TatA [Candidatus Omnitrophota bacterium]|jgi:sec-independent protein translocase protein TatA
MIYTAFGTPGIGEIAVIVVIVTVLFGGSKVPEIARTLGQAMREFKRIANDIKAPDSDDDSPRRP